MEPNPEIVFLLFFLKLGMLFSAIGLVSTLVEMIVMPKDEDK